MQIQLVPMSPGRDAEFDEMVAEYRAAGENVYRGHQAVAWQGYSGFYELLSLMKSGGYPTADIVPMDSYFIQSGERILGEIYIRRHLTPHLEKIGGHIGYRVRPTQRNLGVATSALRLALRQLHEIGVERALVTCKDQNAASARVIEKCGGIRTDNAVAEQGIERRYWIQTGG
jgi:predicted acetyltransferase